MFMPQLFTSLNRQNKIKTSQKKKEYKVIIYSV